MSIQKDKQIGYPLQYSGLENSMDSIVHGKIQMLIKAVLWVELCPFPKRHSFYLTMWHIWK